MTPFAVVGGFDSLRRTAVDNAQDSPPLLGFGQDHFDRIGGGAEDVADFGNFADAAQDVDGIAVAHGNDKSVARGDGLGVFGGDAFELGIVAVHADEAGAGGFVKSD